MISAIPKVRVKVSKARRRNMAIPSFFETERNIRGDRQYVRDMGFFFRARNSRHR